MALIADTGYLREIRSPLLFAVRSAPAAPDFVQWFEEQCSRYQDPQVVAETRNARLSEIVDERLNNKPIGLLAELSREERDDFLSLATPIAFSAGTRIIRSGDHDKTLYLVLDGLAEVIRQRKDSSSVILSAIGPGEVFGEMSLVSRMPRSADVVSASDLQAAVFDEGAVRRLVTSKPALAAKLMLNLAGILAQRLEACSTLLSEAHLA